MGIRFDTAVNQYAQIGAGARSRVEVLARLIARIETFDDLINVVAVGDGEERP